jgi:ferritin
MKLDQRVSEALNQQINNELLASYTYLAMAAYFDSEELPGFAMWFRAHSTEETDHAMRIYEFIVKRSSRVELEGITKPEKEFASPEAALSQALAMEEDVTSQIHKLFDLAHAVKEYGTQNMLHWFLEEQVNEEDRFRRILEQVKAAGDSRWHMLALDAQVGAIGNEPAEG